MPLPEGLGGTMYKFAWDYHTDLRALHLPNSEQTFPTGDSWPGHILQSSRRFAKHEHILALISSRRLSQSFYIFLSSQLGHSPRLTNFRRLSERKMNPSSWVSGACGQMQCSLGSQHHSDVGFLFVLEQCWRLRFLDAERFFSWLSNLSLLPGPRFSGKGGAVLSECLLPFWAFRSGPPQMGPCKDPWLVLESYPCHFLYQCEPQHRFFAHMVPFCPMHEIWLLQGCNSLEVNVF